MDPTKPWDLEEDLLVCPFQAFKHGNYVYDGVEIRVTGDPRDVGNDRYSLEAADRKPTHHLKFTKPALAATHHEDRNQYCKDDDTPECSKLGYQVAMQSYADADDGKKKKTFDVYFPSHMRLTDAPFVPVGEELQDTVFTLDVAVSKYKAGFESDKGQEIENHATTVVWRLVDLGTKRQFEAGKETGPKGFAAMKKKMKRGTSSSEK